MERSGAWTTMLVVAVAMLRMVAAVEQCAPQPTPAQARGPDCYSIVLTMADCLDFVQNGSTQAKPSAACCAGMKSVLKQGPQCLCVVLRDSASLGIAVNTTKALELPGACGVSAPPISQCSGGSPVAPPTSAPQPPISPSPLAAPSPATPPQAAPSLHPQPAPSPSSPSQAPVQPPAASPPAPPAPSGGGFSPAPNAPSTSDNNNNSGANVAAVPFLVLPAVLGIVLLY